MRSSHHTHCANTAGNAEISKGQSALTTLFRIGAMPVCSGTNQTGSHCAIGATQEKLRGVNDASEDPAASRVTPRARRPRGPSEVVKCQEVDTTRSRLR